MKKTLIVNGAIRKNGDTAALLAPLLETLEGEVLSISCHDKISPCVDCRSCREVLRCPIPDEMQAVYPYLEECDNVVLATPVWYSAPSGPLLNITSRLQPYFYASRLRGERPIKPKNGLQLIVGGEAETEAHARHILNILSGALGVRNVVAIVSSMNTDEVPASDDTAAITAVRAAALQLNTLPRPAPKA